MGELNYMSDNDLDKNNQIEGSKNDALTKKSSSTGLKQGKNALNLAQCQTYLDKLPPNTKVKVKILDFESYREFLPLCRNYDTKFATFKYETSFEVISDSTEKSIRTEMTSFKESFKNYLNNQKIDPKITEILQKEVE